MSSSVDVRPDVYFWRPEPWWSLSDHYAVVRGGEEPSLKGIADSARHPHRPRPGVCAPLGRYLLLPELRALDRNSTSNAWP